MLGEVLAGCDGHDSVVGAMHDEHRDVDRGEKFRRERERVAMAEGCPVLDIGPRCPRHASGGDLVEVAAEEGGVVDEAGHQLGHRFGGRILGGDIDVERGVLLRDTLLVTEVGDHGAADVAASFEVVENVADLRECSGAAYVAPDPTLDGHVDQLAYVLHRAHGRIDEGGVPPKELPRVELEIAFAAGGNADGNEQTTAAQHLQAEVEAGQ